jgi:hypothetical protein
MIAITFSCNPTKTSYEMLIIANGLTFNGYFILNSNYYNFKSGIGSWNSAADQGTTNTYYYKVTLTDIVSSSKLSTIIISATGTIGTGTNPPYTTNIEYYLYKTTDSKTDLVDTSTIAASTDINSNIVLPVLNITHHF